MGPGVSPCGDDGCGCGHGDAAGWVGEVDASLRPPQKSREERLEALYDEACAERAVSSGELPRGPVGAVDVVPWAAVAGCQFLPNCAVCAGPMVWRGEWYCDGCRARHPMRANYVGIAIPRTLPVEAWAGLGVTDELFGAAERAPVFSSQEGHNSTTGENTRRDALEALTSFVRRSRAARLLVRGARPTVDGGVVLNVWHAQRIKGEGQRFARMPACGSLLFIAESADGRRVYVEYSCGEWRACGRCLERRRYRLRRGMERVRDRALSVFRLQMSRHYRGAEGRWSERMVTLTVPHSGDMVLDGRRLKAAWGLFRRSMVRHFRARKVPSFPWFRATEAAGVHLHYHVWMLSPFVDQALLHVWWGRALLTVGVPASEVPTAVWGEVGPRDRRCTRWLGLSGPRAVVPWPVVDVRGGPQSQRGSSLRQYVAKVGLQSYVTKASGVSERVHPVHAARAYEALLDDRMVQWAAGWAPDSTGQVRWSLRRATELERAEWLARFPDREVASVRNCESSDSLDGRGSARARDGPKMIKTPDEAVTHPGPAAACSRGETLALPDKGIPALPRWQLELAL